MRDTVSLEDTDKQVTIHQQGQRAGPRGRAFRRARRRRELRPCERIGRQRSDATRRRWRPRLHFHINDTGDVERILDEAQDKDIEAICLPHTRPPPGMRSMQNLLAIEFEQIN